MKIIKNKKGFTLVEILIVVAIIGILALASVPSLLQNIDKAKVAKLVSEYNAFKKVAVIYVEEHEGSLNDNWQEDILNDVQISSLKTPIGGEYILKSIENQSGKYPNKEGNGLEDNNKQISWKVALAIKSVENNKVSMTSKQFNQLVKTIGNTNISVIENSIYLKVVD